MSRTNELYNGVVDNYLAHYGTPGMRWYHQGPGKRWQSQAAYAAGRPNPDAKVGSTRKERKAEAAGIRENAKATSKANKADSIIKRAEAKTQKLQGNKSEARALRKEARSLAKESKRPTMASGNRARSVKKAAQIEAKVARTKEKLNKLNEKYKDSNRAISKWNKTRKEDKLVRSLGKYAMKRESGQFWRRHAGYLGFEVGGVAGNALGSAALMLGASIPVANGVALGLAGAGIARGGQIRRNYQRREGSALLN